VIKTCYNNGQKERLCPTLVKANGLKYLILTLEYALIPISYGLKMSLELVRKNKKMEEGVV
jgi:hypothetical protein